MSHTTLRLILTALLIAPSFANAHTGAPAALDVAVDPSSPDHRFITSTFGPLLSTDGGASYHWVCDEVFDVEGLISSQSYTYLPGGELLAVVGAVRRSRNGGCDWEPVGDFGELNMVGLAQHETQRELIYVSSVGTNVTNKVFRSTDGAESFTEVLSGWGIFFNAIAIAPSDPDRVYVSGFDIVNNATLYRSDDGGESFFEIPVVLPSSGGYRVLGVDPADPDTVYTAFLGRPEGVVYRSTDAGLTAEEVLRIEEDARQVAFTAEAIWLATTNSLFRSTDGGASFTAQPSPSLYACVSREGDALYSCGDYVADGYTVAQRVDGSWAPRFSLADLEGPLACPEGSGVATTCEPLWATTRADIQAPLEPAPDIAEAGEGDVGDCACALGTRRSPGGSAPLPGALMLGLVLGWMRLRRRPV